MLDLATLLVSPAYWLIFIFMLAEGPIVTYVATLFALNGALNIWIVLILSILGSVFADAIYYFLGYYFSSFKFVKRLAEKTDNNLFKQKLHLILNKNAFVTILIIKLLPIFAALGLFYLGKRRFDMKRYFFNSVIICTLISCIVVGIAYSGTVTLKAFDKYLQDYQMYTILIALLVLGLAVLWVYRSQITDFILRKVSK